MTDFPLDLEDDLVAAVRRDEIEDRTPRTDLIPGWPFKVDTDRELEQ